MTTNAAGADAPTVDLWMDIVCPFCLVGEAQLEQALTTEGLADTTEVRVHAFELDPQASSVPTSNLDYLAQKYGISREEAAANENRMRDTAAAHGLEYVADRPMGNTMPVHRVVKVASRHGKGRELFTALQRGYFAGTLNPFGEQTLVEQAEKLGLDGQEVRDALKDPAAEEAVRADETAAAQLGAGGVPFTVVNERVGVSGAAGVEQFRSALRQAR